MRPRVVVVGAGMAGLAAAHRLHHASRHALDLTVLEASNRVGGRIQTAYLAGDQVELGATLIHGITGSPVYEIAQRCGAFSEDSPRENYHDRFQNARFCAEGSRPVVDPQLVHPAVVAYRSSMALVKGKEPLSSADGSVAAFLQEQRRIFLSEQASLQAAEGTEGAIARNAGTHSCGNPDAHRDELPDIHEEKGNPTVRFHEDEGVGKLKQGGSEKIAEASCMWNPLQLQESVFLSMESLERSMSACNSLHDLDLASLKEYTEFPGPHVTIGKGYGSVLSELEKTLPKGTVKFEKKVQQIFWNHSHPSSLAPVVLVCKDGSVVEANHVILTVSLGVLKAGVSICSDQNSSRICSSVSDLRGWNSSQVAQFEELFEPSLPPCKLMAISRLGFGLVNKIFLLLDPSADKSLLTEITFLHRRGSETVPTWLRKAFAMLPIYRGSNVVVLWLSGEEALQMEALSDEEVLDGIADLLACFKVTEYHHESSELSANNVHSPKMGCEIYELKQKLRGMLKGVLRSSWGTNSLCRGSYSFVATGSSGKDIDVLAKPLPKTDEDKGASSGDSNASKLGPGHATKLSPLQLLFAGEATHRNYYSTTHGAFLSGVREADRLLHYFEKGSWPCADV